MLAPLTNRLAARLCTPHRVLEGPPGQGPALTFDDGPDPVWTPRVLDILAERGVPATFFLVGERAERHPGLVQRMLAEGHAVASHSLRHEQLLTLSPSALREAVLGGRDAVEQVAGVPCPLFRPPRGHFDLRIALLARRHGLQVWLWNVELCDWRPETTEEAMLRACADLADGDILLMHDAIAGADAAAGSADRSRTVAVLPRVLALVRDRGMTPVPLAVV